MSTMNEEIRESEELLSKLDSWLDDGVHEAPPDLRDALSRDEALVGEERALRSLFALLDSSRIEVRPDFADRVMESLPRRRPLIAWGVAAAALLALGVGAVALLGSSGAGGSVGLFSALGDFFATSLLAGAGLLGATWSGIGAAVREWLGPSPVSWAVAATVLVALCLLLVSLVRRRVPAFQRSRSSRREDDG